MYYLVKNLSLVPTVDMEIIFCDNEQRNGPLLNPIIEEKNYNKNSDNTKLRKRKKEGMNFPVENIKKKLKRRKSWKEKL